MSDETAPKKLLPNIPDNWKFFMDVDFSNEKVRQYHVDTRDFHVSLIEKESDEFKPFGALENEPGKYVHSAEEVMPLLSRYYDESGGNIDWRYFRLEGEGKKLTIGWQCKYLRIYRYGGGLVICNKDNYAMRKSILGCTAKNETH